MSNYEQPVIKLTVFSSADAVLSSGPENTDPDNIVTNDWGRLE